MSAKGKPLLPHGRMLKAERAKAEHYLRSVWGLDPKHIVGDNTGYPSVTQALKDNIREEPPTKWPLDYAALRLIIEAQVKAGDYLPKDDADLPKGKLAAVMVAGNKPTKSPRIKPEPAPVHPRKVAVFMVALDQIEEASLNAERMTEDAGILGNLQDIRSMVLSIRDHIEEES